MYCTIIAKIAILPFFHLHVDLKTRISHKDALLLPGAVLIMWKVKFPRDDAIHSKWTKTKAITMKLQRVRWKGTIETSLKHFESDCFITKGAYTFDTTTYEYEETLFEAQAQAGLKHYQPYSIKSYLG